MFFFYPSFCLLHTHRRHLQLQPDPPERIYTTPRRCQLNAVDRAEIGKQMKSPEKAYLLATLILITKNVVNRDTSTNVSPVLNLHDLFYRQNSFLYFRHLFVLSPTDSLPPLVLSALLRIWQEWKPTRWRHPGSQSRSGRRVLSRARSPFFALRGSCWRCRL